MLKKLSVRILIYLYNTNRQEISSTLIRKEINVTSNQLSKVIHKLEEMELLFNNSNGSKENNWNLTPKGKLVVEELQSINSLTIPTK